LVKPHLRIAIALLTASASCSFSFGQNPPQVRVRVDLDLSIPGYSGPMARDALNEELSQALAKNILESGRWHEFCWALESAHTATGGELQVKISRTQEKNWEMEATFSCESGGAKFVETLPSKVILMADDLVAWGVPARKDLGDKVAGWFSKYFLVDPLREQLRELLRQYIPVAKGAVPVEGMEKLYGIQLPDQFKHFRYSRFKFIYTEANGGDAALFVQGTGRVDPKSPLVLLTVKPVGMPPLLPTPMQCKEAYLMEFIRQSQLGGDLSGSTSLPSFGEH
jgi:hypothetical protein